MGKKLIISLILTNVMSLGMGVLLGYSFHGLTDTLGWADALSSYHRDAEHRDDPEAEFYIGLYTLEGKGVEKNDKDAFYWISKSAKAGFLQAQLKLAWMYEEGIGVQKNEQRALSLYKEASENAGKRLQEKSVTLKTHP